MNTEQAKEFIRVWQAGRKVGEVAQQLNMTYSQAATIASRLRKKGIPLQKFYPKTTYNVEELKEFFNQTEGDTT